ncbi:sensor histidine kinase [Pseudomonas aeruginosa]|nr:sensor histidine kinase [Pseudomonas aeruginosa]
MRIAVTLVLPILLILSLLGFDFLYSRHLGQERPAACAVGQACRIAPLSHAMDDLRSAGPAEYRWLLAVQERERRLLAQAMHDDIGQYLTGIRTQLLLLRCTAGDGQPALARLERYCQGLDDSFRALLRGLPPPALQRQSLDEALRACVADWQEGQGIACELRLGGPLPPLDAAAGTHLYRLLQEALNNVARHAGASRVRIRLQCRGGFLYLSVRDDGRGCAADPAPGFGLDSMRQRARCLGAELSLRSRPGQGLALRLRMPLERDD